MIQQKLLKTALQLAWSKDTAFPSDSSRWTEDNKSVGQCAVTSLIVNHFLGGKIHKNEKYHHYWNEITQGRFVDFTKEQFGIDTEIVSEGKRAWYSLLLGRGAFKNKTLKRYLILKRSVYNVLKSFTPSIMLLSSNSSKEYIFDIIESIALPPGSIHHFRYQLRWLSSDLREELNYRDQQLSKHLKDIEIVVVYLKQKKNDANNYSWHKLVPLRIGKLKFAFKTGDGDGAFAHFYFELGDYITPKKDFTKEIKQKENEYFNKKYAFFIPEGINDYINKLESNKAFNSVCDLLEDDDFIPDNLSPTEKYHAPIFGLVQNLLKIKRHAISKKKVKSIKPTFDQFSLQSYYDIREDTEYLIEFFTYSPRAKESFIAKLDSDENYFITPHEYKIKLNSNYDQVTWPLISKILERPILTKIRFFLGREKEELKNLDIELFLNLRIRKKYLFRFISFFGDVGFGIGTLFLALAQILKEEDWPSWLFFKWYEWLFISYLLWIILKFVSMMWRDNK